MKNIGLFLDVLAIIGAIFMIVVATLHFFSLINSNENMLYQWCGFVPIIAWAFLRENIE